MPFHSVLPETQYSVSKFDSSTALHHSEKIVWCEGVSARGLVVQHRTNSYFHFITEVIPLVLHYKGDDSVGVIVSRGWQIEALENFGLKTQVHKPDRLRFLFSLHKKRWGVFPREDLIQNARNKLFEIADFTGRGPSVNSGLLVTRSENTSTTGRLLSLQTNRRLVTELGIEQYDPALDKVRQQFQMFAENQKFVGPHGSAFANLVAAKERSLVVEVNHAKRSQWHVKRLCDIFQFSYRLCVAPANRLGNLELDETLVKEIKHYLETGA